MSHHGKIWWTELNTWDAAKAKAYYEAVMGWSFNEMPMGDETPYFVMMRDGQAIGGIFTLTRPMFEGVPDHWLTYLAVDDLETAVKKGAQSGGRTVREPFEVPDVGRIAIVMDINGAAMGFIQPVEKA